MRCGFWITLSLFNVHVKKKTNHSSHNTENTSTSATTKKMQDGITNSIRLHGRNVILCLKFLETVFNWHFMCGLSSSKIYICQVTQSCWYIEYVQSNCNRVTAAATSFVQSPCSTLPSGTNIFDKPLGTLLKERSTTTKIGRTFYERLPLCYAVSGRTLGTVWNTSELDSRNEIKQWNFSVENRVHIYKSNAAAGWMWKIVQSLPKMIDLIFNWILSLSSTRTPIK